MHNVQEKASPEEDSHHIDNGNGHDTLASSSASSAGDTLAEPTSPRADVDLADAQFITQMVSCDQQLSQIASRAIDADNPALNPENKEFDLSQWLRHIVRQLNHEGILHSKASVYFRNVHVTGTGAALQLQQTVDGIFTSLLRPRETFSIGAKAPKQILKQFDGVLESGELLIVLGRPGSGCSTFLKTLCGELHGLELDEASEVHYSGIPQQTMQKEFKGEMVYNQEVDKHFPHLTVGQTLEFAAAARTPSARRQGLSREEYAKSFTKVMMAVFGLSHTYNTKVGSDTVRGVSGGERKRVSIAEMMGQ